MGFTKGLANVTLALQKTKAECLNLRLHNEKTQVYGTFLMLSDLC